MKYAKIEIINVKNKRKTSQLSASSSIFLRFYLSFLHLHLDFWSFFINSVSPSSLNFFLCWFLHTTLSGTSRQSQKVFFCFSFFFPSFSVFPKIKTQEPSISLTYIIYIFSLFHPFTALHNCLMGWDTFFVLPVYGLLSTLKLSHRNWRKKLIRLDGSQFLLNRSTVVSGLSRHVTNH